MKYRFSTTKQRVVTDVVPLTKEQFSEMMYSEKPTEIYNWHWSDKNPFIVITEYNENGVLFYCSGLADKTPEQISVQRLYDFLKYQGLSECYIVTQDETRP
jgi:hypothetical protein